MSSDSNPNLIALRAGLARDLEEKGRAGRPGEPPAEDMDNIEHGIKRFPELSKAALPGLAGDVTNLCTSGSEVDPAAILFTFLAWFGAAAGNSARVMVGDTAHCARLFALLPGNTSRARKGTSKGPIQRLMNAAQDFENIPGMILPPLRPVTKVDGPLSSGEGLIYAVRDPRENAKGEAEDTGVEDKRLLVVEGEFGAAFRAMQREGNTLSTALRTAWDLAHPWEVLSPMTKNSRIAATNPHVCIVGHITKAELTSLLSSVDLYNGLANRLLWVCVRRQGSVALPQPLDEAAVNHLGRRIAAHLKAAQDAQCVFQLTPAAAALWTTLYDEMTTDRPGAYGAATSRAEAQTIRLALIYALLDGADGIDAPHIEAARAAWDYCDQSALYLFGDLEADPTMNRVLEALREGPKKQNDLVNLFDRHLSQTKLKTLLEQLQDAGRITCQVQKTGGRPSTVWSFVK